MLGTFRVQLKAGWEMQAGSPSGKIAVSAPRW
jgi:hypothetical protein